MSVLGAFFASPLQDHIESELNERGTGAGEPIVCRLFWEHKTRTFGTARLSLALNPSSTELVESIAIGGGGESVEAVVLPALSSTITVEYTTKGLHGTGNYDVDDTVIAALANKRHSVSLKASYWGAYTTQLVVIEYEDLPTVFQTQMSAGVDIQLTFVADTFKPMPFACAYGNILMTRPAYDFGTGWSPCNWDEYLIIAINKNESPAGWPTYETRHLDRVAKGATLTFTPSSNTTLEYTIPSNDIGTPPRYFNLDGDTKRLLNYDGPADNNYEVYGYQLINGVDHGDGTVTCDMEYVYRQSSGFNYRVRWAQDWSAHDLRETIYPPSPSDVTTALSSGFHERISELNWDELGGFYAFYQESDQSTSSTVIHSNPVYPNVTITRTDHKVDVALGNVGHYLDWNGTGFQLGMAIAKDVDTISQFDLITYVTNASSNPDKDQNITVDWNNSFYNTQHIEQMVDCQAEHFASVDYQSFYDFWQKNYGGNPPTETTDNSYDTYSITWDEGREPPISDANTRYAFVTSEGTVWVDSTRADIWFRENDGTATQIYNGLSSNVHTDDRDGFHLLDSGLNDRNTLNKLNALTISLSISGWLANTNETQGSGSASSSGVTMGEHVRYFTQKFQPDEWVPQNLLSEIGFGATITDNGNTSLLLGGLPCPNISSQRGASLFWRGASGGSDGIMIAHATASFRSAYETYQGNPTEANRTAMEAEYTIIINNFCSRRLIEACLMWEGNNVVV